MTTDQEHPFPEAASVFVVANTPSYLFKHFLSMQKIQSMVDEMSTKGIVKRCSDLAALKKPTMDDEFNFYVHLVALCFSPHSEVRDALNEFAQAPFRWAKPLVGLIVSRTKATNLIVLDIPAEHSVSRGSEQRLFSTSHTHRDIQLPSDIGDQA